MKVNKIKMEINDLEFMEIKEEVARNLARSGYFDGDKMQAEDWMGDAWGDSVFDLLKMLGIKLKIV